jgi:hypothetical protein
MLQQELGEKAMTKRSFFGSLAFAAASAAVIALTMGATLSAADARANNHTIVRAGSKEKKPPPICIEDGCRGDHCIYCKR